jgi:hypothetical protein
MSFEPERVGEVEKSTGWLSLSSEAFKSTYAQTPVLL